MGDQISSSDLKVIDNKRLTQADVAAEESKELPVAGQENGFLKIVQDEDFFNYLNWLGIAKESGLMVLSPEHHYFFDKEDLKNIRTVVNMMPLNKISNLKDFLTMIFTLIPSGCYFTGCFTDYKKRPIFSLKPLNGKNREINKTGLLSPNTIVNIVNNFLDNRTNTYLSKKNVTFILKKHGFKVIDITELNGQTYFCTRKLTVTEN